MLEKVGSVCWGDQPLVVARKVDHQSRLLNPFWGSPESITTRPVAVVAGSLCISADVVPSGYVKVTALDKDNNKLAEGELIAKTVTDAAVQWKNGFALKELKGKEIKLSFELRDSKLYSFSFR